MAQPFIYDEGLTDSRRWADFDLRAGDIVVSVPSKCGTTWLQMMCAVLIFGPDLAEPLTQLSPWLDMRLRPATDVYRRLAAQTHRRIIKTHTPLDGLPSRADVTYLVMGRDPRDVAVSMSHHRRNLDEGAINKALATPRPGARTATRDDGARPIREEALAWIDADRPAGQALSSLKGLTRHISQAWARRDEPNLLLLHYADANSDLKRTMAIIAGQLGIPVADAAWPELVKAATFESMRASARAVVPDEGLGLFKQPGNFFNAGGTHQWVEILTADDLDHYSARISELVDEDVIDWLHGDA